MAPRVPRIDRCVVVSHALYQRIHCLLPFSYVFQCQCDSLHLSTTGPSEVISSNNAPRMLAILWQCTVI